MDILLCFAKIFSGSLNNMRPNVSINMLDVLLWAECGTPELLVAIIFTGRRGETANPSALNCLLLCFLLSS